MPQLKDDILGCEPPDEKGSEDPKEEDDCTSLIRDETGRVIGCSITLKKPVDQWHVIEPGFQPEFSRCSLEELKIIIRAYMAAKESHQWVPGENFLERLRNEIRTLAYDDKTLDEECQPMKEELAALLNKPEQDEQTLKRINVLDLEIRRIGRIRLVIIDKWQMLEDFFDDLIGD